MKKKRMSPYELEESIFEAVEGRRWATRQSWREVHKEALLLWIEKHKDITSLIPASPESGELCAHAPNMERVPVPAVATQAAVPASVPASVPVVELSPNAKRLTNLRAGLARKQAILSAAYEELKTDPASLRANNLVKRVPADIADYERLIMEVGALVESEEAAKETTGGVDPGGEI